ncbi:hypothetical protein [Pseudomonas phage PPpW-3]|uniref:DNA-binding protein n=1 Tax=Pseudomonas phage PPpW-3 TaxID=1279082 RepID=V5YSU5_9CAUD|nr:hypothetical protein X916_gp30 [Pseudomonas phage PPpW-3]BAO20630.1 hypothetical protein [Pseudomonas phage PPpW-3]
MGQPAEYLTPAELAARWGDAVTTGTLANWRSKGKGPAFAKFGSRVRYRLDQVVSYEAKNLHLVGANDNEMETEAIAK